MPENFSLRTVHRYSAIVIIVFVALHLLNHLVGLAGQQQHIDFMAAIRPIYRNAVAEPLLLVCLILQMATGLRIVIKGWRSRHGAIAWTQALSGLYLIFFLLNHVLAVLAGRHILNLDTDFRFAAAGIHAPPFEWFFIPYYFLAVAALFTHLGCAAYWSLHSKNAAAGSIAFAVLIVSGIIFGGAIVAGLSGVLFDVEIPAEYLATYKF
ncbi:hypothetical protein ACFCW2_05045 [Qipengyuania sp. DSG2-2]|uniref:hypothetical protein n=1 Tax=Qipengyuania sp. DGS2-2 TaxID=3349631 RepID=UPI0036D3AFC6